MKTKNYSILRIDASANISTSTSRKLGDEFINRLKQQKPQLSLTYRDLSQPLPQLSDDWLKAYFGDETQDKEIQKAQLAQSDLLIEELKLADEILLTTPMYNFSIPASLKAWIDLICRSGVTFKYTEKGPVGLIKNKKVNIIISTGGVPVQSQMDFASDYLIQVLNFIGLDDVNIIAADQMNIDAEASLHKAKSQIDNLFKYRLVA